VSADPPAADDIPKVVHSQIDTAQTDGDSEKDADGGQHDDHDRVADMLMTIIEPVRNGDIRSTAQL
jgi:hypothetical protein